MFHPTPMPDDVSPMEASLDRHYWAGLLNRHMMPGLRLAAARFDASNRTLSSAEVDRSRMGEAEGPYAKRPA